MLCLSWKQLCRLCWAVIALWDDNDLCLAAHLVLRVPFWPQLFHMVKPGLSYFQRVTPGFTWSHLFKYGHTWSHLVKPVLTWLHLATPVFTCSHLVYLVSSPDAWQPDSVCFATQIISQPKRETDRLTCIQKITCMHNDTATPYDDNTSAYQGLSDASLLLSGLAAAHPSALLPVSRAEVPD